MLEALAALILIAAVAAVLHFRWGFFRRIVHPWLEKNAKLLSAYSSIVGILLAPAILIGGYVAFMQIRDHLDPPDLVLVFASPEGPRFWVQNPSSKLAPEAQYQLLLFNLSAEGEHGWYLNLEIPTKSVGYIRPGRARGPWAISSVARQGASIGKGHHLFGHGQVSCPNCETVRHYWIYVHVGTKGWYAEITDDETRAIMKKIDVIASGGPRLPEQDRRACAAKPADFDGPGQLITNGAPPTAKRYRGALRGLT